MCNSMCRKVEGRIEPLPSRRERRIFAFLLACFLAVSWPANRVLAQSVDECIIDSDCETIHRPGSKCLKFADDSGSWFQCSNPYLAGCLSAHYEDNNEDHPSAYFTRVCNSDDNSFEHCQQSALNYTEIRVHNANWESAMFYSWIVQIFLSEFLQVPVTVGLGPDTPEASFYNPEATMSWSSEAYGFDHIETANRLGGHCELTKEPCVHVLPEVWIGQEKRWRQALMDGHIDQNSDDGQIGKISWYIPAYTAQRYPGFTTVHGLSGRREELAAIFRSPTTFEVYCREISPTGCRAPDGVANRLPVTGEEDVYFQPGAFKGYFQVTPQNNCTLNPTTCMGHITGAPCTWSTNVDAQAYWNDIALRSTGNDGKNGGYSYGQMIQIWRAANATQSHAIIWWFTPSATIEEFRGTDFEFQPVLLPEPTSTCRVARLNPVDRCSEDPEIRRGAAKGACDNEANSLQKVVASSLRNINLEIPKADRSPGYDAIRNLKVTHLDMNTMLRAWVGGGQSGFAARDAVCEWVVDHKTELEAFMPRGFPREIVKEKGYQGAVFSVAILLGLLAATTVVVCFVFVYRWRKIDVLFHAQFSLNSLILLGLLLVSTGAIMHALEPKDPICVGEIWLVALGYTLELVTVLVKVTAINRMMLAKERRKRAYIRPRDLALAIVPLVLLAITVLTVWTVLDPPRRTEHKQLMDDEQIIQKFVTCSSESFWSIIAISWEGLFICWCTILAFQSRKVAREFNKSTNLGLMIYSHFVFFILRAVILHVERLMMSNEHSSMDPAAISVILSYLLSLDVLTALGIYMIPKLIAARNGSEIRLIEGESIEGESASLYLSSEGSSLRESIREVGASSRAVKEIVAKAHKAMSEYKESQKSSESSSSCRPATPSSFSTVSRRSSASKVELEDIQEEEKEEESAEFTGTKSKPADCQVQFVD
jgi:hypothetical protein